jgi:phosphoglycolate phosphatase
VVVYTIRMAAIIFDFDGTIADSFDYVSEFLTHEAGKGPLTATQKDSLRGLSTVGMAKALGYHWWNGPGLLLKGRRRMRRSIKDLRAFPGIPELIRKLHAEGHQLFVVSTNSARNIQDFLLHQQMREYFTDIYGNAGLITKAPALSRLLKKHDLDREHVVYVGDEWRDVRGAKRVDIRVIAVTWGFASEQRLKAAHPTAVVHTPAQLMKILEEV